MITARPGAQTPAVPPLDDETDALLDSLLGFHPGIDLMVSGMRLLLTGELTSDQTQTVASAVAGDHYEQVDVLGAIRAVMLRLLDPATNPGLRGLTAEVQQQVQQLALQWASAHDDQFPRRLVAETAAVIDGV
ncbi:hypothetical protein [Streptomyces sp. ME19-01-6]|uniref:hypothetical protein n=1 Tax=Streptomyces sp. ME19-01-6 TaxID=3028686 RepID=UPI0029B69A5A|nr:hypothetical protein [Streptomyces sp. ME19-01-6]MDX3232864.1 hypothetical protein [Streptomyces sp. ME19-01-6]